MRQVMNVVAVNFVDLLQLKQAVGEALYDLSHLQSEDRASVTFKWTSERWSMAVESGDPKQYNSFSGAPPQGVSSADWARLVSEELRNHLLNGNRFTLKEILGDVETGFAFSLQRA